MAEEEAIKGEEEEPEEIKEIDYKGLLDEVTKDVKLKDDQIEQLKAKVAAMERAGETPTILAKKEAELKLKNMVKVMIKEEVEATEREEVIEEEAEEETPPAAEEGKEETPPAAEEGKPEDPDLM